MNNAPEKLNLDDESLLIVQIDKLKLTVVPGNPELEPHFCQEYENAYTDNFSIGIEKFGILEHQPLVVVSENRRKNNGFYLIVIGGEKFLRAAELYPEKETYPCIIINKPYSDVPIPRLVERLLKNSKLPENLGIVLITALNESYENSGGKNTNLSPETKRIIAQEFRYSGNHSKTLDRALTPLRRIFRQLVLLPENAGKSFIKIMFDAAADRARHPELHQFLTDGNPSKFEKNYNASLKIQSEIESDVSTMFEGEIIINDIIDSPGCIDSNEFNDLRDALTIID